jgi:hypothetical protein
MKTLKIAALILILAPLFATAAPVAKCYHQIRSQGDVSGVTVIGRGNAQATLTYGNFQSSQTQTYQVVESESKDFHQILYKGVGFSMVVDVETSRANLKATIGNENIHMSDLKCDIHTFDPYPGVTMGNQWRQR